MFYFRQLVYIAIHTYRLKKGSALIHTLHDYYKVDRERCVFVFFWDVSSVGKIRVDCVKEAIPSIFFLLGNDERRVRVSPLLLFGDHQHHHLRLFFRRKAAPPPEDHHQLTKIKKGGRPNLLAKRCIHHYHHHHHHFFLLEFTFLTTRLHLSTRKKKLKKYNFTTTSCLLHPFSFFIVKKSHRENHLKAKRMNP